MDTHILWLYIKIIIKTSVLKQERKKIIIKLRLNTNKYKRIWKKKKNINDARHIENYDDNNEKITDFFANNFKFYNH